MIIKRLGVVLAACVFMAMGCRGTGGDPGPVLGMIGQPGVRTQVGLHPDPSEKELYSMHYQMPGYIPPGTEVMIDTVDDRAVRFTVIETGQQYIYKYHRATAVPWAEHLSRVFGSDFDQSRVDGLSEIDRKGIREGRIYEGMSKEGVIMAAGYPPLLLNPMEHDDWQYWRNRFAHFRVMFENGKVSEIIGTY